MNEYIQNEMKNLFIRALDYAENANRILTEPTYSEVDYAAVACCANAAYTNANAARIIYLLNFSGNRDKGTEDVLSQFDIFMKEATKAIETKSRMQLDSEVDALQKAYKKRYDEFSEDSNK